MIRALLWDVDGTLAETERHGHLSAFNLAFAEAGVTTLLVSPLATDPGEAVRFVEDVLALRPA